MSDVLVTIEPPEGRESTSRSTRRSGLRPRIEVITRGERRRAWAMDQKREIVLESLQPDVRPADVARRHGINTGLRYTWGRQMLEGQLGVNGRFVCRASRARSFPSGDSFLADA